MQSIITLVMVRVGRLTTRQARYTLWRMSVRTSTRCWSGEGPYMTSLVVTPRLLRTLLMRQLVREDPLKNRGREFLKVNWLNDKLSTHYAIFFQRRRNLKWSTPSLLCGVWATGAGPHGASAWTMAAASRTRTLSTSSILTTLRQNSSPNET